MIEVTVVLPDTRRGKAQIDPLSPIDEIKKTIVSDLKLGKPENFYLAIAPLNGETELAQAKLQDGDFIFIIEAQATRGAAARVNPDDFK